MADIKGITIEIGGETTKLQKAMDDVVKRSRDLDKDLRAVNAQLKFDPKNTELLAQKQRLLSEAIQKTKEKLDVLKEADRQAKKQLDNGDLGQDEYDALRREIIKTEGQLKGFETQLKNTGKTAEQIAKDFEKAGSKMRDVGGNMTRYITTPIAGVSAASFKMAADLEDAMGATDQIYKGSSETVKAWAESLESYYGIAEGEALEYANKMGAMLQNIGGLSEVEAAKQSALLVQLAGDLSAMFGGTTEDAVNALTGALKGNNTMLDNYGMGVNEATIKTKALEMGLYDGTGQMDLATKQAATLALIMEQTADAQGQASREAEGASGTMKSLKAEIKNLATEIGQELLPIITPMIKQLSEWIKKFGDLDKDTKEMIVKVGLFAAVLGPLIVSLGWVATGLGSMIKLFAILKGASALGGATTALAGAGGATAAVTGFGKALALLTGPVGWITLAIAAIVGYTVATGQMEEVSKATGPSIVAGWRETHNQTKPILTQMTAENKQYNESFTLDKAAQLKNSVANALSGARSITREELNKLRAEMNAFNWTIPRPKVPTFQLRGGWNFNTGKGPSVQVQWYDKGGIFNSPAIIGVGEKRPEFVGALDDLKKIVADVIDKRSVEAPQIVVQNMTVRDESDIEKIARELYKLQLRRV